MLCTMLCLVLLVCTLTGRCRGDSDHSSTSPLLPLPPAPAGRMPAAHLHSLRRQLMRDNYDYQHSGDESQPNSTARSAGDTANSNAFSAEGAQQDQSKQRGQFEQRGQHEQGRHHKQPGEYEHSGQYDQLSEHEQRGQYQQPGEHEQRGQYDQHDRHEQPEPHKQRQQRKHHGQHEKSEQREQRGQNEQRGPHEQRGQNERREHSEQQEQLGQYVEQEQAQSIEQKTRAAPSLYDVPAVTVPFTDELTVSKYTPDWRHIQPGQAQEYNPSYYKRDPLHPTLMERRPFSDLRGNYEQHGQSDTSNDMRPQGELVTNAQESPDQEYAPDEQEAFDQQDASGTQNDEGSDFSESKKQAKIYNEFVTHSTTRANRLQYYTAAPDERNAQPPHRNAPPPHRNAQPPHRNAQPPHRNAPPPHRNAPNHNISKKDLLYYMDDSQLRRRNNDASLDVPDEDQPADDQLPSPQPSTGPNNPAGTRTSPGRPEVPQVSRARRSFVVTVSADNVTYKLLTLRSRSGRRQHERRFLEERGPAGVVVVSLDRAPLPAFRLPRARRQYMHAPRRRRRHEPA